MKVEELQCSLEAYEQRVNERSKGRGMDHALQAQTFKKYRGKKGKGKNKYKDRGKTSNQALITGVLYVPNMQSNLLSMDQLVENGFTMDLGNNQMKVYNAENKLILSVPLSQSRTFQVQFTASASHCLARKAIHDATWLWHLSYGHLNFKSLTNLKSR
ncbi:retrovirus-related pol polyprotein from transposon TNT 1-94, partial [Trifolium medium]|nr:retrovirus-related pol polyprotein from transposon TNT 1-94 [Trifolium medium]